MDKTDVARVGSGYRWAFPSRIITRKARWVAGATKRFLQANFLPRCGRVDNVKLGNGTSLDFWTRIRVKKTGRIRVQENTRMVRTHLWVGQDSALDIGNGCIFQGCQVTLEPNSRVRVGDGVQFTNAKIRAAGSTILIQESCNLDAISLEIQDGSVLSIRSGAQLCGADISVSSGGSVDLGAEAILVCSPNRRFSITVRDGTFVMESRAHIKGDVIVRFGGRLEIGKYTGVGDGALIRCDESIKIGDYCLLSYDVVVYDTNAHSVDWVKRRDRIESGYPRGTSEVERPETTPIEIGDDVWIGMRSLVLKGSKIGDRAIVGMGTTVTGEVPSDSLVVSPAPRIIRRDTDVVLHPAPEEATL